MDWIIGSRVPYIDGVTFQVQMTNDQIRMAKYPREWDAILALHFIDCTHPMQNAICDATKIKAWRVADAIRAG